MKVMLLTFLTYVLRRHRVIVMPGFWLIKQQSFPISWLHSFKNISSSAVYCRCNNWRPAHPDVPKLASQISVIAQLLVTAWKKNIILPYGSTFSIGRSYYWSNLPIPTAHTSSAYIEAYITVPQLQKKMVSPSMFLFWLKIKKKKQLFICHCIS